MLFFFKKEKEIKGDSSCSSRVQCQIRKKKKKTHDRTQAGLENIFLLIPLRVCDLQKYSDLGHVFSQNLSILMSPNFRLIRIFTAFPSSQPVSWHWLLACQCKYNMLLPFTTYTSPSTWMGTYSYLQDQIFNPYERSLTHRKCLVSPYPWFP